ncbi:Glycosyl hydrolases family 16 [Arthrobacter sp. ov407]|uniref:glycoside hydrolase family 16 protein n=1 Tax=Arthrobacter sp. ov407 TaxID=1761748 RepID=UPI000883079B|nr:glycoside hydrolase family 16 protein [Arthrobacter sp. ov407]SDK91637.1 Glycosyl hydrolases family 16 [Arthrobacter sp. ov407]
MFAKRTAAALTAAGVLALAGCGTARAMDGPAAVTGVAADSTVTVGTQAAVVRGWGRVVAGDEFNYRGPPNPAKWKLYKGRGHAGKGIRSPNAFAVGGGVVTVSGNAAGTTGGMSAKFAQQKYGKWETRMRASARDPKYHPVLLLWPNRNKSPTCAEVDYAEGTSDTTRIAFFLHYACSGSSFQSRAARRIDTTKWHNYAVEWTPVGITGYLDGALWFRDMNPAHQPTVGMHQTVQLDWFPNGTRTKPSQMQVDWIRVYR